MTLPIRFLYERKFFSVQGFAAEFTRNLVMARDGENNLPAVLVGATMRSVFNNGTLVGIASVVAALVANAGLDYWNTRQMDKDAGWVAHTHEMLALIGNLQMTLMYAETSHRSFLATGKDEFLQDFYPTLARLSKNVAELKENTDDNPRQQKAHRRT